MKALVGGETNRRIPTKSTDPKTKKSTAKRGIFAIALKMRNFCFFVFEFFLLNAFLSLKTKKMLPVHLSIIKMLFETLFYVIHDKA